MPELNKLPVGMLTAEGKREAGTPEYDAHYRPPCNDFCLLQSHTKWVIDLASLA
jgi:hypothetical protein